MATSGSSVTKEAISVSFDVADTSAKRNTADGSANISCSTSHVSGAPRRDCWTTINNVPLERRIQTAAVASFVGALPLTALCFGSTGYMLSQSMYALLKGRRLPLYAPFISLYLLYIAFFDRSEKNGRKKCTWLRDLTWWRKVPTHPRKICAPPCISFSIAHHATD